MTDNPKRYKAVRDHDPSVTFASAREVFKANGLWHWERDGYTATPDDKGIYRLVYTGVKATPKVVSPKAEVELPERVPVTHLPKPKGELVIAEAAEVVVLPDAVVIIHQDGEHFARDIQAALVYLQTNRLKVSRVSSGDYAAGVKPYESDLEGMSVPHITVGATSVSPGAREAVYHDPSEKARMVTVRKVEYAADRPNHPGMRVKIRRVAVHTVMYSTRESRVINTGLAPDAEREAERKAEVALIQQRMEAALENARLRKKLAELQLKVFALKVRASLDNLNETEQEII